MSGKGSRRRPTQVTYAVLKANWEDIFGDDEPDAKQAEIDTLTAKLVAQGFDDQQITIILEDRGYD